MTLSIQPLSEVLGAEVTGLDPHHPPDEATVAAIRRALADHLVLCIRGEPLEPDDYLRVARCFGEPKVQTVQQNRHPDFPELWVLASKGEQTNVDAYGDGAELVIGTHWHTDDSYLLEPSLCTMLHAIRVPGDGGDTRFCNMYRVYEALPERLKARLEGLRALHKYRSRRAGARVPVLDESEREAERGVYHPLVLTHPDTGRKTLYLNPNRIDGIEGLADADAFALLEELEAIAFQPRFHYGHRWRRGDIVIWDNRCTMHAATDDYTQPRIMHRVLLAGRPFPQSSAA